MLALLRGLCAAAGISPVILGTLMVLSPAGASPVVARALSSARLDRSDEHQLGVIYTGIYVLWLGVMLLLAAYDPIGQRDVIRVAGLLFVTRGLQRYFRAHELASAYGVAVEKNGLHVSWLSGIGLALIATAGFAPPVAEPHAASLIARVLFALRQMVLGLVALHGVALGLVFALWPRFAVQLCVRAVGATKAPHSAQFNYIVQPLGLYMLMGGLMAMVAQRPGGVPRLSVALGVLIATRGVMRWITASKLRYAFGVSRRTITAQAVALLAAGLVVALAPVAVP